MAKQRPWAPFCWNEDSCCARCPGLVRRQTDRGVAAGGIALVPCYRPQPLSDQQQETSKTPAHRVNLGSTTAARAQVRANGAHGGTPCLRARPPPPPPAKGSGSDEPNAREDVSRSRRPPAADAADEAGASNTQQTSVCNVPVRVELQIHVPEQSIGGHRRRMP